jgi:hypothetical protein
MADFDLDLDALAPESKKVKLGGKIIDVHPPKFKNLVSLMKTVAILQKAGNDQEASLNAIQTLKTSLLPMIPALGDEDMDLTIEQMNTLLQFVMAIATPDDKLEAQGIEAKTIEKKAVAEVSDSAES